MIGSHNILTIFDETECVLTRTDTRERITRTWYYPPDEVLCQMVCHSKTGVPQGSFQESIATRSLDMRLSILF